MDDPAPERPRRRRSRKLDAIRVVVLVLLLGVVAWVVQAAGVPGFLERETLQGRVDELGAWGVVLYLGATFLLVALNQTITPVVAGGAMFGWLLGSLLGLVGVALGSVAQFWIARTALRGPAESLVFRKIPRLPAVLEERGLGLLLVLRLAWVPNWAVNLASGVTRVRFRDFGLALPAMLPGALLICLASDSLVQYGWSSIPPARWGAMAAILVGCLGLYIWATRRWPELRLRLRGRSDEA